MVQRFFKLFSQEISGLHEAAFLLAVCALGAKVLALLRDRLLAHYFGASASLDVYYAAFRIPDFLYVSLASLVASAVLIPFIIDRLPDQDRVRTFFNRMFTLFFFGMAFLSVLAFFLMPFLARFIAPGFTPEQMADLVLISRIMMGSPFLLGLSGLFASVTQSLRRFFVYAIAPVLYNLGIIAGVVFFYPLFGLPGLAYGVLLGAGLHLLVQFPVLLAHGFIPRFTFSFDWREIKEVFLLSFPRTITVSVSHLTILVLTAVASLMHEGSITVFTLAYNLQSVPLTVIGISYSVAAFPTLAKLFSHGETRAFVLQILNATRHIIFWSFPILVLFIVLRAQIVRTILGTGAFGWTETRLTAAALALFAVSIIAQSLILLFVRGYYAAGHTRKPLIVNLASSGLIVLSAYFFITAFRESDFFRYFIEALLRVSDVEGAMVLALPLAFSLGTLANVFLLWFIFKRDFAATFQEREVETQYDELARTFRHSFYASVLAGFVAFQFLRVFDDVFDLNTFWGIFAQGFFSGTLGIVAGMIVLFAMGNKELREIFSAFSHRFWRRRAILPDQGEL
ncbi:MAG: hypothetical protein A3D67_01775 [Candidatus Lloydbacteria bacterium RIFCSPHIGHO2_02_FULL_51_22]|uniref:Lipid II flippase MurJ n=3 Tax=Candidatus Lloydiibacteriota TaxID=1817910 RepID=A0A1G2DFS9_9BACT|nr:MAG: hypothetical protein A3D67_01775 [Candidatus Lloydbacteria bacterium RIFCSPHIGHO2_02_FULL_51_22]OGZ13961.1 MAG: hypothetical protein A3J08_04685 [Candidatus Lloydbacteria bacterium RIFCSPLOWO2_02_FULL_51_11]OGZ16067.1 MAG: hypothetical protein A3G11_02720 [Candidatus Lloydbacteria bacterium RIFCSPLOWO2_12_FULL_51_9]